MLIRQNGVISMIMTNDQLAVFLYDINRAELYAAPVEYIKAVRVTLLALGYDPVWVSTEFTPIIDTYFADALQALEPVFDD